MIAVVRDPMSHPPNNNSIAKMDLPARRLQELEALYEISRSMQTLDLDKILRKILEGVTKSVGFDRARLYMVNKEGTSLILKMAVGLKKEPVRDLVLPLDRNNSVAARAVLDKKPFVVSDASRDPRVNPALVQMFHTKAFAAVPLVARSRKVKGIVPADNLYSGKAIDQETLKRLVTFANQAAVAIENAEVHSQLKKFNSQLKRRVAEAKAELLHTQEQLIQSEKLAALGELSAGIAHEIRNPLTSISLLVHSLSRQVGQGAASNTPASRETSGQADVEDASMLSDFRLMEDEIARLNNIVTQFLEYAKPAKPALQKVDVQEILAGTKSLLLPKFHAKKLQWKDQAESPLPTVYADKFQIQQVFINLALNALSALEQKGTALTVRIARENTHVVIEFADDGPGIKKADLRKLFVPFFTTKAKGLGLGLSISQRIIASHNGSMEAQSKSGHGARFVIRLPMEQCHKEQKLKQNAPL